MDGKHCRTALSNNWVTEKYDRMVSTQANVTPVKKTTLALAIATAAPALIFAAPAHADQSVEDIAFLATLLERPNIHFASDDQAILGGKAVCAMMKQGDSRAAPHSACKRRTVSTAVTRTTSSEPRRTAIASRTAR